jgi:transcriptional regulator with XRE-family HTH domain
MYLKSVSGFVFTDGYRNFVILLAEARRSAGVTQTELARRLSKPQSFVSKIENSERRVDIVEFCAIARALEVDPQLFFASLLRVLPPAN